MTVPTAERSERHAVGALLGRTVTRDSVRIDLSALDSRLRERSGVGGLDAVLTALHGTPPQDRRAARAERDAARTRPLVLALDLVRTRWAADWVAGLRSTGLLTSRLDAETTITQAARVLNQLTDGEGQTWSRVELGASLLGDAHALDRDRLLHHIVLRGLAAARGTAPPERSRDRERLWTSFSVEPDLLSRTCLAFGLRPPGAGVAARLRAAADDGDPVHLTEWDLRSLAAFGPPTGTTVLICENPRVVEAMADHQVDSWAAVCTAGEPNLVVGAVLTRLRDAGADLRYHGDFDWPGIAIANRVIAQFGAQPWHLAADDYLAAVRSDAPPLTGTPVQPAWDNELGAAMRANKHAVHEESVLTGLLAEMRPILGAE
ncbi:TIGR02679 family protein [Microlunatus ginsengisoli]|uniref:TIGR02679 family protein n=1 Tax=Microlunatus ginsengisoli TaxID=363863 RepID=UPI0031CE98B1